MEDIPDLPQEEQTEAVAALFEHHWKAQQDEITAEMTASGAVVPPRQPSALVALFRSFSYRLYLAALFESSYYGVNAIMPFLIKGLLQVISSPSERYLKELICMQS